LVQVIGGRSPRGCPPAIDVAHQWWGTNGAGRLLAQRLLAYGEHVVDVPATLSARSRGLDTGDHKTDALDAHVVAVVVL